jgi:ribonuclease HII
MIGIDLLPLRAESLSFLKIRGEGVCGIDEAGRGPLVGPVCAAAVMLSDDFPFGLLDDSKAMSPGRRSIAYERIIAKARDWSVAWATCDEIGSFNILRASLLAMKRAYYALFLVPAMVFVDGDKVPDIPGSVYPVILGDSLVPSIMAASILAKVARDRLMDRLDRIEPAYGFASHKGYPTPAHREAIRKTGPSLWVRPGFKLL